MFHFQQIRSKAEGRKKKSNLSYISCLQTPGVQVLGSCCCSHKNAFLEQHDAKLGFPRASQREQPQPEKDECRTHSQSVRL